MAAFPNYSEQYEEALETLSKNLKEWEVLQLPSKPNVPESWVGANSRLFGDDPLMSREMLSSLLDQAILLSTFIVEFHVPASPERETAVRMMKELLARRQG